MDERLLLQYLEAIDAKKNELFHYTKEQLDTIEYPACEVAQNRDAKEKTAPTGKICIGSGIVLSAVGLVTSKVLVGGVGVALICAGLLLNKRRHVPEVRREPVFDYSALSDRIYAKLLKIKSFISEDWDTFLGKQKDSLKSDIQHTAVSDDVKNQMIEEAMNRSVIEIPMMQVLSELSAIAKKHSVEDFKAYVTSFQKKIEAAIDKSYTEQKESYARIMKLNDAHK